MYGLFEGDKQIGGPLPTESDFWDAALIEGLVTDEAGSQVLPLGYRIDEEFDARLNWKLPRERS
jgi:hypothetical protein